MRGRERGGTRRNEPGRPKGELRCRQCGYEMVVRGTGPTCPMCRGSVWDPVRRSTPSASAAAGEPATGPRAGTPSRSPSRSPGWQEVENLLADLAATGAAFASATSRCNTISQYEPGWRLMLETDTGSRWVAVSSIQACWETFERRGSIRRQDVLEPGRCSAFMMSLFAQVDGVVDLTREGGYLALPRAAPAG